MARKSGWIFSSSKDGCVFKCDTDSAREVAEPARLSCKLDSWRRLGDSLREIMDPALDLFTEVLDSMKGACGGESGTASRPGVEFLGEEGRRKLASIGDDGCDCVGWGEGGKNGPSRTFAGEAGLEPGIGGNGVALLLPWL